MELNYVTIAQVANVMVGKPTPSKENILKNEDVDESTATKLRYRNTRESNAS